MIKGKDEQYWNAFAGRMFAYGLGATIIKGVTIHFCGADYQDHWCKLNEWLRQQLPELTDDIKACEYLEGVKYPKDVTSQWTYSSSPVRLGKNDNQINIKIGKLE